jgi:hypothetical protein
MTKYRPPFRLVIEMVIDKSLGFTSGLVAYLD